MKRQIRETGEGGGGTGEIKLQQRRGEGSSGTNGAHRKRGRKKGKNKFLNIMNINAQSLKYKMDELKEEIKGGIFLHILHFSSSTFT